MLPLTIYINSGTPYDPKRDGRRRNPLQQIDVEQDGWHALRETVLLNMTTDAVEAIGEWGAHLDSVMGRLWPPLSDGDRIVVSGLLLGVAGSVVEFPGSINSALLARLTQIKPEMSGDQWVTLAQPIMKQDQGFRTEVGRSLYNYYITLADEFRERVVDQLIEDDLIPRAYADVPPEDLDVTAAVRDWLGEWMKLHGTPAGYIEQSSNLGLHI
jgi:hypothetical protein